jgi:hypothetical protein
MSKRRMSIEVSTDLAAFWRELADREDVTLAEILRRGLSVMRAYEQQIEVGRTHLCFTSDPTKLDVEIVGVLNSCR